MQKKNVMGVYNILSQLKLKEFKDGEVRKNLFFTYLDLQDLAKNISSKVEELRKQNMEDKQEELNEVIALENQLKTAKPEEIEGIQKKLSEHADLYTAVKETNDMITQYLDEDVDINIHKVDKGKFVEDFNGDMTMADLMLLEPIFE